MAAFNTSTLLLSILMAIIPGGPGLSGTRMSPFRILLQLRMIEVMVTTGAIKRAKFQSNRHPPTYHHVCNVCKEYALQQKFSEVSVGLCEEMGSPNILYRPDALPVVQPAVSENWREKVSHSTDLLNPSLPGIFHKSPWLSQGGCRASR